MADWIKIYFLNLNQSNQSNYSLNLDLNGYSQSNYSLKLDLNPFWGSMVQYAGAQCLQSVKRLPIIGPQCSLLGATFAQEHIWGTCSWKNEHWIFRINTETPKSVYLLILNNFSKKWLFRANHYAHETRIEILCKTPVSILRDLPPGVQNYRKTCKYSFLG